MLHENTVFTVRESEVDPVFMSLPYLRGGKANDSGRDWGQEEKGMTEDEMAGWHHQLDGHKFE